VTSQSRWPELPETPTFQELGISGFPTEVIFGLAGAGSTPAGDRRTMNGAVNDGLKSASPRSGCDRREAEWNARGVRRMLDEQARQWKAVIDEIGVTAE